LFRETSFHVKLSGAARDTLKAFSNQKHYENLIKQSAESEKGSFGGQGSACFVKQVLQGERWKLHFPTIEQPWHKTARNT
jgi:hypothetical protein